MRTGPESPGNHSPDTEASNPAPSDAFSALGNETRMAVLRALAAEEPCSFSALHDATDEDTSAGFAYHLRQLTGQFLRQREDERYELTHAGRAVARAVRAGTYTESIDRDPVSLDEECPFCGKPKLTATVSDNVTEIACEACERPLLGLSFPPSGYESHDTDSLPDALDSHHRRRIGSFADGVCPACAGSVTTNIEPVEGTETDTEWGTDAEDGDTPLRVQTAFACETCGANLRCPVSLVVLEHPAVAAFYNDHARDVRDRPIWNVGTEWRESVISRDPWCVRVRTRLDGEDLLLYVAGDGTVVDYRRAESEDMSAVESGESGQSAAENEGTAAESEQVGDGQSADEASA